VSRYQEGKINLDFTKARDSGWQWYQLGHMQVCTSPQTDNNASTPQLSFFTGRMPFLQPNQQRQSTEGITELYNTKHKGHTGQEGSIPQQQQLMTSICQVYLLENSQVLEVLSG